MMDSCSCNDERNVLNVNERDLDVDDIPSLIHEKPRQMISDQQTNSYETSVSTLRTGMRALKIL